MNTKALLVFFYLVASIVSFTASSAVFGGDNIQPVSSESQARMSFEILLNANCVNSRSLSAEAKKVAPFCACVTETISKNMNSKELQTIEARRKEGQYFESLSAPETKKIVYYEKIANEQCAKQFPGVLNASEPELFSPKSWERENFKIMRLNFCINLEAGIIEPKAALDYCRCTTDYISGKMTDQQIKRLDEVARQADGATAKSPEVRQVDILTVEADGKCLDLIPDSDEGKAMHNLSTKMIQDSLRK
jgi:hypothetical protein